MNTQTLHTTSERQDKAGSSTRARQSASSGEFTSFDGSKLYFRTWRPARPNGRAVCLLHRGHEHSGRLEEIATDPALAGFTIYAHDYRGHGRSPAPATPSCMDLVRDLDAFVRFLCRAEGIGMDRVFVIANSVSGVIASAWVHDFAPDIAGMALVAPAFRIRLYLPFALQALGLATRVLPGLKIPSYVRSSMLTHDKDQQQRYDQDPLITRDIPARQLVSLDETARRVVADAGAITCPTLVLSAGRDVVVDTAPQGEFFARLSSPLKSFVPLPDFYHGVLYEKKAQEALRAIADFMDQAFARKDRQDQDLALDRVIRVMEEERDRLAHGRPGPCQALSHRVQRGLLRSLGRLSQGIRIGLRHGFDSGVTLDHVYADQARGTTPLGRLIDRNYLDSIGWQGIRRRKANLLALVEEKILELGGRDREVRILDIAGGPARYLVELARDHPRLRARVRDYQEQNINQGRDLARRAGLDNIEYEMRDAFDPASYQDRDFQPHLVIISGIFELFANNSLVERAIRGAARMLRPGGWVIYTGQPYHPQLAYIAHVLNNHQNGPWVMRRRSTLELDRLFARAGFVKEAMRIDDWGIFTVSAARLAAGEEG